MITTDDESESMPTPPSSPIPPESRGLSQPSAARRRMLARRRRTVLGGLIAVALGVGGWGFTALGADLTAADIGTGPVAAAEQTHPRNEAAGIRSPVAARHRPVNTPKARVRQAPEVDTSRCATSADACVDLDAKVSWLQQAGRVTYGPVRVLPGVGHFATPAGIFHVAWKDRQHTSSEYGESMPYAVFFAAGGIAFHQGSLTTPSHGCVHLTAAAAATYYAHLPVGAEVDVF